MSGITAALMGAFLFTPAPALSLPATATATEVTEPPSTLVAAPATATLPAIAGRAPEFSVRLTGYNAVPAQTDSDPSTTASGSPSNPEVVAARSRDMADTLPFGTVISITAPTKADNNCGYSLVEPLIGYRVIADTMNVRFAKHVDVLFDTTDNYALAGGSTNASRILGVCDVTITVIGHIDLSKGVPATQRALASLITRQALVPSLALK